jgi:D-alanyl-lipoteichoic acid acyltransferase DltB (MBOAT superfamily)
MVCTPVILPPHNIAAVLLHLFGDRVHARSSLAFPDSLAVPIPISMNRLNSSNAQDLALLLTLDLLLSKFLHWMTRRYVLLGMYSQWLVSQTFLQALYTARRPETASEMAKRIKNPKWWVRVVLFLCCASPSADDSH